MTSEDPELLLRRHALPRGYSDEELRRLYTRCGWQRLGRGAYVERHRFAELEALAQHRMLIDSMVPIMADDAVLSHQSAAAMLGLPMWGLQLDRVHVSRNRRNGGRIKRDVSVHCSPIHDVVLIDGFLVTSPARTVVDLGRTLPFEQAVVIGDAAMRMYGISRLDLAAELELAKCRHGIAAAKRVVEFVDPRSESVGESRSRVHFHRLAVSPMSLQGNVFDERGMLLGRVDFYDENLPLLGEFDGRVKYGRLLRPGQDAGDAVFDEKVREDLMRDVGFGMTRWIWDELHGRDAADRVIRARERVRAFPPPIGRIEPAPLPDPVSLSIVHL